MTGGGKTGAEKRRYESNDKNGERALVMRLRAGRITGSSFRSHVVFKYRRLLRETDSSQSGQSGAIIQEEFMTNVRALSSLATTVHRVSSLMISRA